MARRPEDNTAGRRYVALNVAVHGDNAAGERRILRRCEHRKTRRATQTDAALATALGGLRRDRQQAWVKPSG